MKRIYKTAIITLAVLATLSGGTYGAWYAWDNGLIGNNPRAPVAAAMEDAVRKQALINIMMSREFAEPCVRVDLGRPQPEVVGVPGISMYSAPGRYSVTLLLQTDMRNQPARDIQIRQMDYLASKGLLSAAGISVDTDSGALPAKNYQMTWAGFAENSQNYGNSFCLAYGHREFYKIEKIEKLLEKVMDHDVYEVTYSTKVTGIPDWASAKEVGDIFPKLQKLKADADGKAKVIRTSDGWRAAYEVQTETAQATQSAPKGASMTDYMARMMKAMSSNAPTLEELNDLVATQASDVEWVSRNAVACMPINIRRGGDEKIMPGNANNTSGFTVTYYDRGSRRTYEYADMARTLHILFALEGAGLAKMEQITPPPPPVVKKGHAVMRVVNLEQTQVPQEAGIRYTVQPEALEVLGLTNYGGGCIPAGKLKIEPVSARNERGSVNILARGKLELTPELVAKIAEELPALKSMIENGVPLTGRAEMTPEDKWRISGLSPIYPTIGYATIPARLAPLLPLTAAASPAKPVKAPNLLQKDFSPAEAAPAQPPTASSAAAPAVPPGVFVPPLSSTATILRATASGEPPYPAAGAPVHMISIYEATKTGGAANIAVSDPDAVLLLFAYEPVEWHINAASGIRLKKVVAVGYKDQRVTFSGGGKPEVVVARNGGLLKKSAPTDMEENSLVDAAEVSRALTGAPPKSFQAGYVVPPTGFAVGPQTPGFTLPIKLAPSAGGGAAHLRSVFPEAIDGDNLMRGPAGAYTDAWSDRAYSAGKVYFEGKMMVTGSIMAHVHANIGLCLANGDGIDTSGEVAVISHGEQKLYKNGDIFGVAADLDQQLLYYHINGTWITGTPGSGKGLRLEKDKKYRACFFAAGTVSSEKPRSDTTWEANFGGKPFSKAVPARYVPYQGKS